MTTWRRWAVPALTKLLQRLEPELRLYPPEARITRAAASAGLGLFPLICAHVIPAQAGIQVISPESEPRRKPG